MFGLFNKAPKELIYKAQEGCKYTPDAWELQSHAYIPLFVYNEMAKDHFRHDLLEGQMFFCMAFTVDPKLLLWKHNLGDQSTVIAMQDNRKPGFSDIDPSRIKGELWYVRPGRFKELDTYMKNTVQFERSEVRVIIPYFEEDIDNTRHIFIKKAHMYFGKPSYWDDLLPYRRWWDTEVYSLVKKQQPLSDHKPMGPHFYYGLKYDPWQIK